MSLFITFEGGEGSGKSTQAKLLYRRFQKLSIPSVLVHEPGVTTLGRKIRRLLKWSNRQDISQTAELLLFNAARAQLVEEVIKPSLAKGIAVVCDRYADSTTAYQGYGRGLDPAEVAAANSIGTQGIMPDLTVFLNLVVEKGLERKKDKQADRFEAEDKRFHRRVREGFLKLAEAEPERWLVIDATGNRRKIAEIIWQRVNRMLATKQ
jgi:dTMP kinase